MSWARVTAWLDDLVDLGCNGLLLGPVFDSQTHGYDTVDHLRIDPRLGDDADADALFDACRQRGIRVLLDGVFNHVGRAHPWWQEAVAAGPGSPAAARFATGPGARTVDGLEVQVFEGHENLVVLNHDHPEVAALVTDVMAHWLDRGVDGWRLDAAYAVPPAFWRTTIGPLRERFPDAWFVGEVIHGDYVGYVEESGLDSLTQYELWKAVRNSIEERNWFELAWSLPAARRVRRGLPADDLHRQPRRHPGGVGDQRPAARRPRGRRAVPRRRNPGRLLRRRARADRHQGGAGRR